MKLSVSESCHTAPYNASGLGCNRAVVRLDHVFDGLKAGAAFWLVAAGAGAVSFRNAGRAGFTAKVLADFFVAERVAEADHHFRIS